MVRFHFLVSGIVQGVGFRHYTYVKACEYNLSGWVRNTIEGKVEVLAEGPAQAMEMFMNAVKTGPSRAQVDRIDHKEQASAESLTPGEFRVRYD